MTTRLPREDGRPGYELATGPDERLVYDADGSLRYRVTTPSPERPPHPAHPAGRDRPKAAARRPDRVDHSDVDLYIGGNRV